MSDVQDLVDRPSKHKERAAAMGFEYLGSTSVLEGAELVITGRFKCVCDKIENYVFRLDLDALDPAYLLEAHGAFSREHLEEDGYSEEQIQDILARGARFDEENP